MRSARHAQPVARTVRCALPLCVAFLFAAARGESQQDAAAEEESDPTRDLLKQLTIAMLDVVDERTVAIRPTSSKDKQHTHLRLGNVGPPPRGALSDSEYAEKVSAATAALAKLVDKQAVWYKAAPDAVQPPSSTDGSPHIVIADLWSKGGSHVNTALKKEGHLTDVREYESDIAKDILGAAAKAGKEESQQKLNEALSEFAAADKAAKAAAKAKAAEAEAEEAASEGFGMAGWLAIAILLALAVGVATNFGQPSKKRPNLNRKKGTLEQLWLKLKGA